MFSHLRVILQRGQNVVARNQIRKMANWHRPNFLGGKAEPHELGKSLRQLLYREGDIVLYIAGTLTTFAVIVGLVVFATENEKKRKAKAESYIWHAHYNCYPYPTRVDNKQDQE
uniref:Uncharacterized protein LOC100182569 n=1 Tax=Phallusia mammillata TaxID=59560 RepID=A0A6F9DH52_9ASCI|nr:uncharacterized protein LOC100182569 [Phallusia mammillata]